MVKNFGLDELNILNYQPLIEEIWILIFKYLNEFERRQIEMICKSFYIICRSKPHFISKEIKSFYEFFGSKKKLTNFNLSGITKLSVRNCTPILVNDIGLYFINIKELIIRSVKTYYSFKKVITDRLSKELNLWINLNRGDLFKSLEKVYISYQYNIIYRYFEYFYLKMEIKLTEFYGSFANDSICFECDSLRYSMVRGPMIMVKCKHCPKIFCSKCIKNKNVLKVIYPRSLSKENVCYFCFTGLKKCIDCNNLIFNSRNFLCEFCINTKSKNVKMNKDNDEIKDDGYKEDI